MSGQMWWASVASKASACNSISRADYLHMMQSCRVGLARPYPHGQAPDLACDCGGERSVSVAMPDQRQLQEHPSLLTCG